MVRIYDPIRIVHPRLREFAFAAAWIASVAEAANDLEDFLVDVPADEPLLPDFPTPWLWECDSIALPSHRCRAVTKRRSKPSKRF